MFTIHFVKLKLTALLNLVLLFLLFLENIGTSSYGFLCSWLNFWFSFYSWYHFSLPFKITKTPNLTLLSMFWYWSTYYSFAQVHQPSRKIFWWKIFLLLILSTVKIDLFYLYIFKNCDEHVSFWFGFFEQNLEFQKLCAVERGPMLLWVTYGIVAASWKTPTE